MTLKRTIFRRVRQGFAPTAATVAALYTAALVVFPAAALAASGGAHDAHGAGHAAVGADLAWPIVNFAIYAAIIVWVYRKHIAPILKQRSEDVQQFLSRAGAELATVEKAIAAVNLRLSRTDSERESIVQGLIEEGERTAVALLESAREDVQKIEQDGVRQSEHEFVRVRHEVTTEMVRRATSRARERLTAELSPEDNRRLRDEVLSAFLD